MRVLTSGCVGGDVTELQQKLTSHGFSTGADGAFGPATQAAVLAFQRSQGMVADGVVGPATARALGLETGPEMVSAIPAVSVEIVARMFPVTPVQNIEQHLPIVLDALITPQLSDKDMVLMALATIRAETESFMPISEGESTYNTLPGGPTFGLYDNRKDLGNQGPPDGERYRGRGFVQLTGRANYSLHGARIGLDTQLLTNPELANDPRIAAQLLASFLKAQEVAIRHALLEGDLKTARQLVNGGSQGLDRFSDAYRTGHGLIPDDTAGAAAADGSTS